VEQNSVDGGLLRWLFCTTCNIVLMYSHKSIVDHHHLQPILRPAENKATSACKEQRNIVTTLHTCTVAVEVHIDMYREWMSMFIGSNNKRPPGPSQCWCRKSCAELQSVCAECLACAQTTDIRSCNYVLLYNVSYVLVNWNFTSFCDIDVKYDDGSPQSAVLMMMMFSVADNCIKMISSLSRSLLRIIKND